MNNKNQTNTCPKKGRFKVQKKARANVLFFIQKKIKKNFINLLQRA